MDYVNYTPGLDAETAWKIFPPSSATSYIAAAADTNTAACAADTAVADAVNSAATASLTPPPPTPPVPAAITGEGSNKLNFITSLLPRVPNSNATSSNVLRPQGQVYFGPGAILGRVSGSGSLTLLITYGRQISWLKQCLSASNLWC